MTSIQIYAIFQICLFMAYVTSLTLVLLTAYKKVLFHRSQGERILYGLKLLCSII